MIVLKTSLPDLTIYFLATGVLGENILRSESIDLEGVTLIFIESLKTVIFNMTLIYH